MSDPSLPAKDAMVMWRKALRRTDDAKGIAKQGREPGPGKKAQRKTVASLEVLVHDSKKTSRSASDPCRGDRTLIHIKCWHSGIAAKTPANSEHADRLLADVPPPPQPPPLLPPMYGGQY
jgi:hypothetical protein